MIKPLFASWLLAVTVGCATLFVFGQTPPPGALNTDISDLKAPEIGTRIRAAESIGARGAAGKPAVPALLEMLKSNEKIEKLAAIIALAHIGPEAEAAVPALQAAEANPDKDVSSAAKAARLTIAPPISDVAMSYLSNPYVYVPTAAVVLCVVVMAALGLARGGSKLPDAKWREEQSKAAAARAKAAVQSAPAPTAPLPPTTAAPARQSGSDRLGGKPRARMSVSKPLNTFDNYVNAPAESPDSIKRDFMRAQDDLQRIISSQEEVWEHLESEDLRRDPERARMLRKNQDEFSIEHYHADVRVKALEIKIMEFLLGDGSAADPELVERTEARLKEKWDVLRAQLEAPTKIVYKNGQWLATPNGQPAPVEDVRAKLREFDVIIHERVPVATRPGAEPEPDPEPHAGLSTGELISALDPTIHPDELEPPWDQRPEVETESTEGAIVMEPPATPSPAPEPVPQAGPAAADTGGEAADRPDDGPEKSAPV